MKRMPKYTAGMFKKKMPRFGASSISMPRLPRIKKYAEGGVSEAMLNEKKVVDFLNQPETEAERKKRAAEKKAAELARKAEKSAPTVDPDQRKAKGGTIRLQGQHVHHSAHVKKHAAGFMHHDDHVKKMCGGGYMKGMK